MLVPDIAAIAQKLVDKWRKTVTDAQKEPPRAPAEPPKPVKKVVSPPKPAVPESTTIVDDLIGENGFPTTSAAETKPKKDRPRTTAKVKIGKPRLAGE